VLNLCLVAVAMVLARQRSRIELHPTVDPTSDLVEVVKNSEALTNTIVLTNAFGWAQVESSDYPTYISNLRGIGCPEKTIADIIVAEVDELYEHKRALVPLEATFWESDLHAWRSCQKRTDEQIRLEKEKTFLLRQLLNVTWFDSIKRNAYDVALIQFFSGILDDEKAVQLLARVERLEDDKELLLSDQFGIHLPEDDSRTERLMKDYRADIQALLGPGEIEEMKLRGALGNFLDKQESFSLIGVSAIECKQIARFAVDVLPENSLIPLDKANWEARTFLLTNETYQAQVRSLLGEERYGLYRLVTRTEFKSIYSSVNEHGLPREMAIQITRLAELAENEAKQWDENPDSSVEARTAGLKTIRLKLEQSIGGLVGTNRDAFIKENEEWLKQLEGQK
jgi:hypothetical protein